MSRAEIAIDRTPGPVLQPEVYGHFLESAFFGNIEGGVFDEGSPRSVGGDGPLRGCREDVIEACRALGLPVVRWPGGNFTSAYRWEDGTGPRDARPRRLELAWGSEESNRFGTPEFLAWCDAVGTAPYLHHSARDVQDAVRWVEYTNHGGDTELTRRRAADGHPAPHGVRWWGIGNEVYGPWQMGHRPVEQYVRDATEHMRFMSQVDPGLRFVVSGWEREAWTDAVVAGLGEAADLVSLHLYGIDRHRTDPSAAEFDAVVAQPLFFERTIADYAAEIADAADRHHVDHPPAIALDEWNNRHLEPEAWPEPRPGADGGVAPRGDLAPSDGPVRVNRYSPRTLADALMYAGVFHAMHRAASGPVPVAMANAVNLVTANGVLVVRPGGVVRTPVMAVWDLYQNRFGRRPLRAVVTAPSVTRDVRQGAGDMRPGGAAATRREAVPLLDASAALDAAGRLTVAVINRSATETVPTRLVVDGARDRVPRTADVVDLGVRESDLFASNSLDEPDRVALSDARSVELGPDREYAFPPHSVTLLVLD